MNKPRLIYTFVIERHPRRLESVHEVYCLPGVCEPRVIARDMLRNALDLLKPEEPGTNGSTVGLRPDRASRGAHVGVTMAS